MGIKTTTMSLCCYNKSVRDQNPLQPKGKLLLPDVFHFVNISYLGVEGGAMFSTCIIALAACEGLSSLSGWHVLSDEALLKCSTSDVFTRV